MLSGAQGRPHVSAARCMPRLKHTSTRTDPLSPGPPELCRRDAFSTFARRKEKIQHFVPSMSKAL